MTEDDRPLGDVDTKELERELAIRQYEKYIAAWNAKKRAQDMVVQSIDALILMTPHHDRTSCSDDHPQNWSDGEHVRCERCQLMHIKDIGMNNGYSVRVSVEYDPLGPQPKKPIDG